MSLCIKDKEEIEIRKERIKEMLKELPDVVEMYCFKCEKIHNFKRSSEYIGIECNTHRYKNE